MSSQLGTTQSVLERNKGWVTRRLMAFSPLKSYNMLLSFCFVVSHSVTSDSMQLHRLYSPPASSVHGILQARILEWVAMPSSRGSFPPRDQIKVSHNAGRFSTIWDTREARWVFVPVLFMLSGLEITKERKNFQEQGQHLETYAQ